MMDKKTDGYTLIELLLALVVGSVVLAATYSSYLIVSRQYSTISAFAEVQETGLPVIRLIARDLRIAGYRALDANLESNFGTITNPVTIVDSGNACCDSVAIIYDLDLATRQRVTYYTAPRNNPTRNALYVDRDSWDGANWTNIVNQSLVADYVDDFQLVGTDFDNNGDPMLVDVSMIFRNKNILLRNPTSYSKPAYNVGNYNFTANDSYHRDEFSVTVNVRNLRENIY